MKLYLILTKQWFDRHLDDKTEEYRQITPYWCARLLLVKGERRPLKWWKHRAAECNGNLLRFITEGLFNKRVLYDTVVFSNGMKPVAQLPRFEKRFAMLRIGIGMKEWGAPDYPVFIICCGVPLNVKNIGDEPK